MIIQGLSSQEECKYSEYQKSHNKNIMIYTEDLQLVIKTNKKSQELINIYHYVGWKSYELY